MAHSFERSTPWDKAYSSKVLKWRGVHNALPELAAGSRVLELGCGTGKTLSSLLGKGLDVYAVDFSGEAVKLCSKLEGCKVGLADVRHLGFKAGFFDAVFCFHVLAHLPFEERKEAAVEIVRVLKKGGRLFFRDFSVEDFRFGKGKLVEENSFRKGNGITTHYFKPEEIIELFSGMHAGECEVSRRFVYHRGIEKKRAECVVVLRK